eukprot:12303593-Alexandrium_andersonii.AAC.1
MHAATTVVFPVPGLPKQMSGRLCFQACSRASSASSWSSLWFAVRARSTRSLMRASKSSCLSLY